MACSSIIKHFYEVIDTTGLMTPFEGTWRFPGRAYRNVERIRIKGAVVPVVPGHSCLMLHIDEFDERWPLEIADPPRIRQLDNLCDAEIVLRPSRASLRELTFRISTARDDVPLQPSMIAAGEEARVVLVLDIQCTDVAYATE